MTGKPEGICDHCGAVVTEGVGNEAGYWVHIGVEAKLRNNPYCQKAGVVLTTVSRLLITPTPTRRSAWES
jgi:hypothetical protein